MKEFGDSYTDGSHCDYMWMAAWESIVPRARTITRSHPRLIAQPASSHL